MRTALITGILLATISSCNCNNNQPGLPSSPGKATNAYAAAEEKINEAVTMLREGDLVVRNNSDFSAQAFREFSKTDRSYSHAGLVFFDNGYPMIYHLITGDENPDHKLRRDSLQTFVAPRRNFGFAIYRYQLQPEELAIFSATIRNWYSQGLAWDSVFSLQSDDRMYCSEMVYKALKQATKGRIILNTTKATPAELQIYSRYTRIPVADIKLNEGIAIDNLYLHPSCSLVKQFSFTDTTAQVKNNR